MPVFIDTYQSLLKHCLLENILLVIVSKKQSVDDILTLYKLGQKDFGENYVQEILDKQVQLPKDIRWHFIGHLQTNKVKYIAPFIHLIQSVDSISLLLEINKQAIKNNRIIHILVQIKIALDESKTGLLIQDLDSFLKAAKTCSHIIIKGFMGITTLTNNEFQIKAEFNILSTLFNNYKSPEFNLLSMGMSNDYNMAIQAGSNVIRIGSLVFGERLR